MDVYQKNLIELFSKYRPSPEYPTYPSYHEGLYLEDYFLDRFFKENIESKRYLIPVCWTTCYNDNKTDGLQQLLDTLDSDFKYFTISQHDDAIRERLPKNTICFNAGGNAGGVPIPLVCSPIKKELIPDSKRDIFCSFVGSVTHQIRYLMLNALSNNDKYHLITKQWTSKVSDDDFYQFINVTSRSIFSLCPRGYGRSSFRLYEVMQLGSIPVFVYDDKWVPFQNEIDWNEFSVLIHSNDIYKIDDILSSYTDERINQMQSSLYKYWEENFTMESIFNKIINKI